MFISLPQTVSLLVDLSPDGQGCFHTNLHRWSCSAVQCSAVQCSELQFSAVRECGQCPAAYPGFSWPGSADSQTLSQSVSQSLSESVSQSVSQSVTQ